VLGPGVALEDDAGNGDASAGDSEMLNGIGGGAALEELDELGVPYFSKSIL